MRTSFILHIDSLVILEEMTNEQKGILFDAIYKFNLGKEVELDFAMKMAFTPFKNQFIRDGGKYDSFVEKQKENGKKGGRPKKSIDNEQDTINPQEPNVTQETQPFFEEPKKAYKDSVSDSKKVNEKDKVFTPPSLSNVIKYFNDNGYTSESAEAAFYYYNVRNWKDSKDKKVNNWKLKMQNVWFKDEHKEKPKILWVKVRLGSVVQDFIKSNYEQAVRENKLNCDNPEIIKEYYK